VDTATMAAEKRLLQLLAEGRVEEGAVSAEDFITPERKALAQKLLSGMKPGAILEQIEDEQERSRAASVLTRDSGANDGQGLQMTADCLRILHVKRIEEQIDRLKELAAQQKGEDKRKTLLEIQKLTKERQTAGRKE